MTMFDLASLDAAMAGGLVVSCQPVQGGPLDDDECVVRLALAAVDGGAAGIRLEGATRVALGKARLRVPVIGIVKRDLAASPVRITPHEGDVDALVEAGADIVALDATARTRPVSVADLVARIHRAGCVAMADCATLEEARHAAACGCDIVGTTLAGYTGGRVPDRPDFALLEQFAALDVRVMAEGRYADPASVARARTLGAWAVTVGTAITRIEMIVADYSRALASVRPPSVPDDRRQSAQAVGIVRR